MNRINLRLAGVLFAGLYGCLAVASAQAKDFACWVGADDGRSGFVLVETRDADSAWQVAATARVRVAHREYRPVVEVRECIDHHRETFRDEEARTRWSNYPL